LKKYLKYVAIIISALVVLLVVAYFLAKKYEPEVKDILVYEINRQLTVPVKVDDINFSLIQRFPYASLRFSNVVIPQVIKGVEQPDTLIFIKDLYLQMGLMSVLRKKYEVTEAEVNTGFFDMDFYTDGSDNFHFWKTSTDSAASGATFSITDILIKDFNYRLKNSEGLLLDIGVVKSKAKGNFGTDQYKIESISDLWIHNVAYANDTLYRKETFKGDLQIEIDRIKDIYSFSSSDLRVAEQAVHLTGTYIPTDKQSWTLELKSTRADLEKLSHLLPLNIRNRFSKYKTRGKTDLDLRLSAGEQFDLDGAFSSLSGKFQHNEALGTAEIRGAKGKFEMRNSISSLFLDELNASIGPGKMTAWGKIIDFDAPSFDLNIEGSIDLKELKRLLNIEMLKTLEGEVVLDGRLQGNLPRESSNETLDLLRGIDFIGEIKLVDGVFQMEGQDQLYDKIDGDFQLKDNSIIIKAGTARVNKSPFQISGIIKNALPYISRKGEKLSIQADFKAKELNFNDILTRGSSKRDTTYNFSLPSDVAFDLSVDIEKISFRKFEATQITGNAYYKSGLLTLNPFSFRTADGDVKANVHLRQLSGNQFETESFAQLHDIDLKAFFIGFENFGQQVIQAHHLEGRANATIQFSALFKNDLSIDSKSIKSNIELMVLNGKLKNLESLQAISDYLRTNALWRSLIKVNEFEKKLKIINFDTLQNTISIENQKVHIPAMTIGSSALTLNVSGTHSFDNKIDYSLNFRLSQLLRTGKKESSEFGYIVDDQTGLRLFMRMQGDVDNPQFSLDGDAARNKRKQEFDREKDTFKSILKEEFGLFKSDTTLTGVPKSKTKGETQFSVDWEDFKDRNDTSSGKTKPNRKKKKSLSKEDEDLYDALEGDDDL